MDVHWDAFKADTRCCMEHHNSGRVTVYIISAGRCLAYCICCRVRLLDRQRPRTWKLRDVPRQEAGWKKEKMNVCVRVSACVYKLPLSLSKNRLHASFGEAHNNSKPSHWQRLSIAVKDCEFDKWILSWPSTCARSAWENQGGTLRGRSVLSPKCHVWEHRRGSLRSQTMWLRLTKCCLSQSLPPPIVSIT